MKKCSTQVLSLAVPMVLFGAQVALTGLAPSALGIAVAMAQSTPPVEIAADAPDKHVVVKGDTLWAISGKFLEKPWRWPEIWELNKEQIRNPHLIYPGDIVYLDRTGSQPRLRLGRAANGGAAGAAGAGAAGNGSFAEASGKMVPMVRVDAIDRAPIPTISHQAIEAFLNRPLIVDEQGLQKNPRIIGTQEGRVYLGRGEIAYVRGIEQGSEVTDWHIYRPARPLVDPDTRKPIAYEALFVGSARLERKGDPSTLRITGTAEEIGVGDRLMPAERGKMVNYAPRPPEGSLDGRIVSVHRGVAQAGRNSVLAVNLGKAQGLDVGHVLQIRQRGTTVRDRDVNEYVKLPDEPVGHLLVFRVFDNIAYGLVMDASKAIAVGDAVVNP